MFLLNRRILYFAEFFKKTFQLNLLKQYKYTNFIIINLFLKFK